MKKVLALFLVCAFLVTVSGCTTKSEYDKLMDKKNAAEKRTEQIATEKADLAKTIQSRERELKDLRNQLKDMTARAQDLERQLAKANSALQDMQKKAQ